MRLVGGGSAAQDDSDDEDADNVDTEVRETAADIELRSTRAAQQREKQLQLIEQLKRQLEDLETFAYEVGRKTTSELR